MKHSHSFMIYDVIRHRHARCARVNEISEIKVCEISEIERSIQGTVYSNDFENLTRFFSIDAQQERNWEFMMYLRCSIGNKLQ